ncbi:MAG: fibrinogen-like YCDxxxxGGGW domain-containing protein, partial [Planctomycetota bacterium]
MDATQNFRLRAVIAVFLVAFGGQQVAHAWLGGSQDEAARSAAQILNTGWSVGDAVYWIDPNGGDTADAFQVFCDMTAAGGGWMLVVNSIAGAEPPTNDMASNTGTASPGLAHTRDMSFWAIEQDAEIRHEIVAGMRFHAKYTGKYHDAMPNFIGWTTLSGHEAGSETMIAYHFGWLWSTATDDNDGSPGNCAATYGAPWYYNDCWTILPCRADNGLAQGPERNGIGVIARYSIYVRELSTPSLTVSSNGTGGGGFGDPCTWAGGIVPGPVDTTVIVSGDTVTLDSDFTVAGLSIEAGAVFDEATSSMTIAESGTLVNNGIIRVSRPILGTGPVEFGLSDVSMIITTQGMLSQIQVERIDSNHPQAYGNLLSGIYWSITPTGSDYTLGLTLPHNISPDSNAHLARHEGGVIWTLGRSSSTATHVTLEGVTQLSDWTVCTRPTWPSTIYVDADAPGANDGTSWEDAFNYLQDALAVASFNPEVNEIRVAEGIYKPDQGTFHPDGTGERTATFELINAVGIYGGYAGYWAADPNERDIELYETILSGDINTPGDNSDNSYHVVTAIGTDANAVLDGLTITAGNASGYWPSLTALGGGMLNMSNSRHRVTNCTFSRNCAESGSGMWNDFSS